MANPLDLVERAVERTRKTGPRDGWATIGWHEFTLLADAAARAAELERENSVLREQNIALNDGCVRYERELERLTANCDAALAWGEELNGEIGRLREPPIAGNDTSARGRVDHMFALLHEAERSRDAALARAGELEELADDHQEQIASLHERMTVAHDRAESLTTDLHEMREAAEFRAEQVRNREREAASYGEQIHALNRIAGELRARVGEVERELAEAKEEQRRVWADGQKAVDSARRERDQLRAERDRLLADNATFHNQLAESVSERVSLQQDLQAMEEKLSHEDELYGRLSKEYTQVAAALRTRLAAVEGALRRIVDCYDVHTVNAARAALAPSAGEPEQHRLVLSARDAERVLDALERPAELSPALAEAADRYKAKIASGELVSDAGERQEGEFRRNCECTAGRVCRYCEVVHGKL